MTEYSDDRAWMQFCARLFMQNQFAIKLGLEPMKVAMAMTESTPKHRVVLIAGTNGKGTTASALSALLCAQGLRVGFYSSPHLVDLTERFRVNGEALDRQTVLKTGQAVLDQFGGHRMDESVDDFDTDCDIKLTFFEMTTLMATMLFNAANVDVGLYEVGLGGRLDATNALEPDLSIVTTIGLDHQKYLGETLELIAMEKLGIARQNVPLIVGEQEYAQASDAIRKFVASGDYPAWFSGEDFGLAQENAYVGALTFELPAGVIHQKQKHFACALAASISLGAVPDVTQAHDALSQICWYGRYDLHHIVHHDYSFDILLDGAHNPDGARALFNRLDEDGWCWDAVLVGVMGDKDAAGVFAPLMASANTSPIFATLIDNARSATSEQFDAIFEQCDQFMGAFPLAIGWEELLRERPQRVLVFGSLYLMGEVFSFLDIDVSKIHQM